MNGMSTQERLDDICAISGLSENIVRRVLDAERQSIVKSLKRGERATLIGRCVIRPELRSKIEVDGSYGGAYKNYIKLSSTVATSMESMLQGLTEFEQSDKNEANMEGVWTPQIAALN